MNNPIPIIQELLEAERYADAFSLISCLISLPIVAVVVIYTFINWKKK